MQFDRCHHRHRVLGEPFARHRAQPLQPRFFEERQIRRVVDVVERVEVAPADVQGNYRQRARRAGPFARCR
jgi:hypothetical protein